MHLDNQIDRLLQMLRIRRVEEALAKRYSEQKIRCPMHLSIGQEGVAVGVCSALAPEDAIMSTHRAHAHYLAKGGDLKRLFAELYGKKEGCCGGIGGSMHLLDLSVNMLGSTPIVGGTFPLAVGVAFAQKLQKEKGIIVCFFGEGMTEEGVFFEGINFASLHHLPILFVCENNLYSVYSPLSVRQPSQRNLVQIVQGHGIAASQGNGNDVEDVFRQTSEARQWICGGKGPYFLEFSTYRWREHCGPHYDNDLGYRTQEEFLSWKSKCPIANSEARLKEWFTQERRSQALCAIEEEIAQAFAFAEQGDFPNLPPTEQPLYAP